MKYRTYPEDAYPDYRKYAKGDRVVYVGQIDDSNSYEDMIGKEGIVTDFWEGDDETNPSVEVTWGADTDDYFSSVNPWMLELISP